MPLSFLRPAAVASDSATITRNVPFEFIDWLLYQIFIGGCKRKIWSKCSLSCHVLFISVPRLLLALKDNIDTKSEYINHIKENITNCDLVIWDDIGTKQSTTFENENLLYMIDTRINNNKANIFTSNLNRNELHIS